MRKAPVHKWVLHDEMVLDGSTFFVYRCVRCKGTVLNGQPHPKNLENCEK